MKRIARHTSAALLFILCISFTCFSQDITGIWKGYFITEDGNHYRLEFQVKQNAKGQVSVSGVSYSWQDDIKFYGKATMTGSFVKTSKNFRIKEIKTVEVKSTSGFGTCIMNYDLVYSRSGKEEFLEGTYLGKPETKGRLNTYNWGDCGGGRVSLRRVTTSDFYIEPFLRKKNLSTPPPVKDTVVVKTPTPVKKAPVVVKKDPFKKPVTQQSEKTIAKTNPRLTQRTDSTIKAKVDVPLVKTPIKPVISAPAILKERTNELMKSLVVTEQDVTIKLYDNGEIDGDTISIYYDNKLLLANKGLSATPITVKIKVDDENQVHELVMVAENLGRIPPNTSLMIVDAGDQRFDVRITSTEQKNALVRFRYQPPK